MQTAAQAVRRDGEPMKIKCAIFDFDGTLFDSMFLWENVGEVYLRSIGKEPKPDLREAVRALSLYQAACYLQKEYDIELSIEEIMQGINRTIENFYFHQVKPKAGVISFLERMKQEGIPMCIATATDRYLIEAALSRCRMETYFDTVFTCGEVGHGKDEPVIYQKAMERFDADRNDTVVFEDALHAVHTAKGDGFVVAAVFDDSEKRQKEIQMQADCYIVDFEHTENFWDFVAAE